MIGMILSYLGGFICHRRISYTRWYGALYTFCFTISVFQNWVILVQEEQAKINNELMKGLPNHCRSRQQGFVDGLVSFVSSFYRSPVDDCLAYHKIMQATPYTKATLIQALSMTIAQYFIAPLEYFGENLSKLFSGAMRHLPIIASPFIFISVLLIGFLLIIIISRYELNLPFGLGSLRPTSYTALMPIDNDQKEELHQLRDNFAQLQHANQQLLSHIQQIANRQLEHNSTLSSRKSRSLLNVKKKNQARFVPYRITHQKY